MAENESIIHKVGVLVMSYGTPESMDQIEAYYTHIRRGRPPAPEQLNDLLSRYEAIAGGFFPLRENTNKQVQALEATLNLLSKKTLFRCYQGLKHASPFIEDGIERMAADGVIEGIGIVLAPHYSSMSVGSYIQRAQQKASEFGISIQFVTSYQTHPKLIEALVNRVRKASLKFPDSSMDRIHVIFSAHSLPARILEQKDPYPEQLLETSRAIAEQAGISHWQFAWQSAGRTPEPWLGPDILEVLETIQREVHVDQVLICPVGFVSDHLEVLYDIDIECQKVARQQGFHLERTESLNTDPLYIETLADEILKKMR